jgi:quercetin dioxygenase-like cupin family protein
MPETDEQFLLTYPNLDNPRGEVLLENEHVVLQRLVVGPGEWEGIHSHPSNQVYIHIKGGTWSERRSGVQSPASLYSEAGSVGWVEAVEPGVGHEYGNVGDTTIDIVLVTLK